MFIFTQQDDDDDEVPETTTTSARTSSFLPTVNLEMGTLSLKRKLRERELMQQLEELTVPNEIAPIEPLKPNAGSNIDDRRYSYTGLSPTAGLSSSSNSEAFQRIQMPKATNYLDFRELAVDSIYGVLQLRSPDQTSSQGSIGGAEASTAARAKSVQYDKLVTSFLFYCKRVKRN